MNLRTKPYAAFGNVGWRPTIRRIPSGLVNFGELEGLQPFREGKFVEVDSAVGIRKTYHHQSETIAIDCKTGKLGGVQTWQDFKSAAEMPGNRGKGTQERR